MSSSQSSSSRGSGFEAYIASLAAKSAQMPARRLHPDFETWQACFDFVRTTEPLAITLPGGHKTNLELMKLLDALRKQGLELVDVGDKPGCVALCTPEQAAALKAQLPSRLSQSRHYLKNHS